ncbi:MAG: hypothetical protein QOH86_1898 [Sphingomonadales bacterium]|jgi:uncharacterized protein (TIGR02246 family)|nr:hypothetical protein [Sphingomonadales bacterium]
MTNERFARAALAALLVTSAAACDRSGTGGNASAGNAAASAASAADDVKRVEQDMLAAWKAKDPARLASYYTDDAAVANPGETLASGRDAILKSFAAALKDPAFSLDYSNLDTRVSGDVAYTRGTFRVTFTNPETKKPQNLSGNYLTVFAKQPDGGWKAAEDFATEGPAAAPPPGA